MRTGLVTRTWILTIGWLTTWLKENASRIGRSAANRVRTLVTKLRGANSQTRIFLYQSLPILKKKTNHFLLQSPRPAGDQLASDLQPHEGMVLYQQQVELRVSLVSVMSFLYRSAIVIKFLCRSTGSLSSTLLNRRKWKMSPRRLCRVALTSCRLALG